MVINNLQWLICHKTKLNFISFRLRSYRLASLIALISPSSYHPCFSSFMSNTQECCVQSSTSPGGNTQQDTNCTATCPLSQKTIQVRRTRHAGHCWRSRDELIRDVLLWIPTHGRAKAGRPARTYIQQLCEDTGCCPEDLPRAMNDREEWRKRVRDIRAASTI